MNATANHGTDCARTGTLPEPARVPAKTFKACRLCRRLKMRCEGNAKPPCHRCSTSGADCVFDFVEVSRKRKVSDEDDLRDEIRQLKHHVASLAQTQKRAAPENIPAGNNHYAINSFNDNGDGSPLAGENDLSPEQLSAPVNAVNDLAPKFTPEEVPKDTSQIYNRWRASGNVSVMDQRLNLTLTPLDDVVTKELIGEDEARKLFNM